MPLERRLMGGEKMENDEYDLEKRYSATG